MIVIVVKKKNDKKKLAAKLLLNREISEKLVSKILTVEEREDLLFGKKWVEEALKLISKN